MIFNVGQGAGGGGSSSNMFFLDGTLTAGLTTLTIASDKIGADTIIQEVATSNFNVAPTGISAVIGGVTLTFEQVYSSDINVKVGCI